MVEQSTYQTINGSIKSFQKKLAKNQKCFSDGSGLIIDSFDNNYINIFAYY